jgi:oligo-alginate lyase
VPSRSPIRLCAAILALAALRAAGGGPNDDWAAKGPPHPTLKVGEILPPRIRTPAFLLKDAQTLFTPGEIATARDNVARYPRARELAESIRREADYWAAWTDVALWNVVPGAEVPRSFECSTQGCPIHGRKIFEVNGGAFYPWIIDPKTPFKIKCPIGGETYPSNDYGRFYRSGFKDRSDFKGPYVDDGRGWVAPNGERYWFVAHANHWLWFMHVSAPHENLYTGLAALGRTYLLTGDPRYAHKAAVLLRRIAEVYPNMDYESQSRYGQLMAERDGTRYTGKVLNAIWETYFIAQLAETYDAIWPSIDGDAALHGFYEEDGRATRSFIEANIIEEGIDAVYQKRVRGNFGMHQRALLVMAIVRQHADNARYLRDVLDKPDGSAYLGLRPALDTLIWRDGEPYESPGYNLLWLQNISAVATLLPRLGVDISTLPRLRRLYDAPMEAIAIGRHTPAIGDTASAYGGVVGEDAAVYQRAFRAYADPRYASFLAGFGAGGEGGFRDFESLLHPPIAAVRAPEGGRRVPPQPSRLLSGYGVALLNNKADDTGASLYFGQHGNHFHLDRLHIDLFANGQPMTPDLGYPDAMNEYVPGVFTWSTHTVSHNTVMVDNAPQPGNAPGIVRLMASGETDRVIDVEAPGTYPQCDVYRRTLVMVDTGPHQSYFVDFFAVSGGRDHLYILHGPPGSFALEGGSWTPPAKGTLAGENVAPDQIYDDPVLGAPGYAGPYSGYKGSGLQHFTGVRRHLAGGWTARYTHERDPAARLDIRILEAPGDEVMLADARLSPVKSPQLLRYLLVRRTAVRARGLSSEFVSVLEPHSGHPSILSAGRVTTPGGTAVVLHRGDGRTDVVFRRLGRPAVEFQAGGHRFVADADALVASFGPDAKLESLFFAGGPCVAVDHLAFSEQTRAAGRVVGVDPAAERVQVALDDTSGRGPSGGGLQFGAADAGSLSGRIVRFTSEGGTTAYAVADAKVDGNILTLTLRDDLLVGRFRVTSADGSTLGTQARLMFAPSYAGVDALDYQLRPIGRVKSALDDRVVLNSPPPEGRALVGRDVTLLAVGKGDRMEAPFVFDLRNLNLSGGPGDALLRQARGQPAGGRTPGQ